MKHWIKAVPLLASALLLLFGAVPAGAEELPAGKEFILMEDSGRGLIAENPTGPAFWEYPTVPAGQTRLTQGTLTLKNSTGQDATVRLDEVELPYTDPAALDYLAALTITIRDGDTVLYDGPYSAINDGGLRLTAQLASGQTKTYTISLRCAFSYEGNPDTVTKQLFWAFTATSTVIENPGRQAPPISPLVLTMFCVAGGLVLICAVAGGYAAVRKGKH